MSVWPPERPTSFAMPSSCVCTSDVTVPMYWNSVLVTVPSAILVASIELGRSPAAIAPHEGSVPPLRYWPEEPTASHVGSVLAVEVIRIEPRLPAANRTQEGV